MDIAQELLPQQTRKTPPSTLTGVTFGTVFFGPHARDSLE